METERNRGEALARLGLAGIAALSVLVSACSAPTPKTGLNKTGTKEYFAEAEYGVKASPRVSWSKSGMRRGGGRYQVGRPYQIKGRWYYPKEDASYAAQGAASWYGEAFHGRLTANGEVYDMTHLTAAHPTMPLPSYARVTNLKNGTSVIVRVNDRGPFARDRVIDLSKRAAEMLDYSQVGVAKVHVEYVGPAPLHGQDDRYLLASYRPGGHAPDPSDGLPTGVMIAMNGPTPSQPVPNALAALASQPAATSPGEAIALPAVGPIVPDRPGVRPDLPATQELALLSYADQRVRNASQAFDTILNPKFDGQALAAWWEASNGQQVDGSIDGPFVNLGVWSSRQEMEGVIRALSAYGRINIEQTQGQGAQLYALSLLPRGDADLDQALRAAWAAGAVDAFVVRD